MLRAGGSPMKEAVNCQLWQVFKEVDVKIIAGILLILPQFSYLGLNAGAGAELICPLSSRVYTSGATFKSARYRGWPCSPSLTREYSSVSYRSARRSDVEDLLVVRTR